MNLFDKIIERVSPKLGFKRAQYRAAIEQVRSFQGASKGRRGAGFGRAGTPNSDNQRQGATLKDRARWLYKNNSDARKAIRTIALNVVGKGIRPSFKNQGKTEQFKELWHKWADTKLCDFKRKKDFWALQFMVMRTLAIDGECLVVRTYNSQNPYLLELHVLECDFLDNSKDTFQIESDGGFVMQGVRFDKTGRIQGYYIYDRAPENETVVKLDSEFYPADRVLHIYDEERPGQVRGIPFLAPVMMGLNDLAEYADAQLMRQKIAACFSIFVTSPQSVGGISDTESSILAGDRVNPGTIERLAPGEEVHFGDPPGAEGYEPYVRKVQQSAAAGVGITYEQLTGDMRNVNFSSGRMGWMEAQRQFENLQQLVIDQLCEPVFEWFIEAGKLQGLIPANAEIEATWTPQGRFMIDPAKELKAYILGIEKGLFSWQSVIRILGEDPDSLMEEITEDKPKLEAIGITFSNENQEDE